MARRKISNEWRAALGRSVDDRAALNGISYVLQTGVPWEDLPQDLGDGSGMATLKAPTGLAVLHWLGIKPSYSPLRVSDDHAYVEALFRTAKYRPEFPVAGFEDQDAPCIWVTGFVHGYSIRYG